MQLCGAAAEHRAYQWKERKQLCWTPFRQAVTKLLKHHGNVATLTNWSV